MTKLINKAKIICDYENLNFNYDDVEKAAINFRKALILSNDDILLEYFDKQFGEFKDD